MSEEKSPAFQFYPKDFLTDDKVLSMSNEEVGAYIKLLCVDWLNDGIEAGLLENFKGGSCLVTSCFQPHANRSGFFTNKRLIKEREKKAEWRKKSVKGGKRSAEVRKKQRLKAGNHPSKMVPTKSQPKANSSSSSSSSTSVDKEKIYKKENDGKESPKDYPSLRFTTAERDKIKARYSEEDADVFDGLDILQAYAENNTRKFNKYKSHYRCMITWVLKEARKIQVDRMVQERNKQYLAGSKR